MNWKKRIKHLAGPVITLLLLGGVAGGLFFNNYARHMADSIQIKSQYTFYIQIDGNYQLVEDKAVQEVVAIREHPAAEKLVEIGRLWIGEYTAQFTQRFLPRSKALKNVTIDDVALLDVNNQILKITFSAELRDANTEYFDSWNAMISNGRLICEWIVEFKINYEPNGTLRIAAKDISNSDGYSIKDNTWHSVDAFKETEANKEAATEKARYEINNQSLNITYDGGNTWKTVPVDVSALLAGISGKSSLVASSYIISEEKTAFLYGGASAGIPLTLLYSDDRGNSWTSAKVAEIGNVSSTYLQFINKNVGYVVYAHDKTARSEMVEFLKTTDGGETWKWIGSGPQDTLANDVGYVTESVGFICYEYTESTPGRMYITRDGGISFSEVNFPSPSLINDNNNGKDYDFGEIFVSYEVPRLNNGILTARVFQSARGTYRNGNVYAQFTSVDYGQNWIYDSLYEKP